MQCFCHTNVDSQEDKWVGITNIMGGGWGYTGRSNHAVCWAHSRTPASQSPSASKRKLQSEGCSGAAVWWMSEAAAGQLTDGEQEQWREEMHAGGWGWVPNEGAPNWHWTCSFISPSSSLSSSLSLQQSTPDGQSSLSRPWEGKYIYTNGYQSKIIKYM